MGDDNLKMTYETLFELARREKQRGELQELEETFIEDVKQYISAKKSLIDAQSHKHDLESTTKKSRILQQLDNIKGLLRDLYERRERKIVNMAINRVKVTSSLAGEDNLLPPEQEYYRTLMKSFADFRQKIFLNLVNAQGTVSFTESKEQAREKSESQRNDVAQTSHYDESQNSQESDNLPDFKDASSLQEEPASERSSVLFLKEVGRFYDEDLSAYGPYKAQDKAELPKKLADVLIKKGSAEPV